MYDTAEDSLRDFAYFIGGTGFSAIFIVIGAVYGSILMPGAGTFIGAGIGWSLGETIKNFILGSQGLVRDRLVYSNNEDHSFEDDETDESEENDRPRGRKWFRYLLTSLTLTQLGMIIGGIIGSIVPGIGSAFGAAIGAGIGVGLSTFVSAIASVSGPKTKNRIFAGVLIPVFGVATGMLVAVSIATIFSFPLVLTVMIGGGSGLVISTLPFLSSSFPRLFAKHTPTFLINVLSLSQTGMILGAVIGTFIFPGVGTTVGLAVGAFLGGLSGGIVTAINIVYLSEAPSKNRILSLTLSLSGGLNMGVIVGLLVFPPIGVFIGAGLGLFMGGLPWLMRKSEDYMGWTKSTVQISVASFTGIVIGSVIGSLFLPGLGGAIGGALGAVSLGPVLGALAGAVSGGLILAIGAKAIDSLANYVSKGKINGTAATLNMTAIGAGIGFIFSPIGAAVGAGVGFLVGLITSTVSYRSYRIESNFLENYYHSDDETTGLSATKTPTYGLDDALDEGPVTTVDTLVAYSSKKESKTQSATPANAAVLNLPTYTVPATTGPQNQGGLRAIEGTQTPQPQEQDKGRKKKANHDGANLLFGNLDMDKKKKKKKKKKKQEHEDDASLEDRSKKAFSDSDQDGNDNPFPNMQRTKRSQSLPEDNLILPSGTVVVEPPVADPDLEAFFGSPSLS